MEKKKHTNSLQVEDEAKNLSLDSWCLEHKIEGYDDDFSTCSWEQKRVLRGGEEVVNVGYERNEKKRPEMWLNTKISPHPNKIRELVI